MSKYKSIWLDLDDTLLDFGESSKFAFADLMDHIKAKPEQADYDLYHEVNAQAWEEFERGEMTQTALKTARFQRYFDKVGIEYDGLKANTFYLSRIVVHPKPIDRSQELLETLHSKGYETLIITNGMKEVQRPRIDHVRWTHYFKSIVVSDEIGCAKPANEYFQHAFNNSNFEKDEILVVGDSLNSDVKGAIDFDVDVCWHNLRSKDNNTELKPTYEVGNLTGVLELL